MIRGSREYHRFHVNKTRAKYKEQGKCNCGREIEDKEYRRCNVCRSRKTPEQENERIKEYRRLNRDKILGKEGILRRSHLKKKYGITIEQYGEMESGQGNLCAICELPGTKKGLCVDHNHSTGKIRALLCSNCNLALGLLYEDIKRLESMKLYIIKHL